MAITISGENNNDRILASDGVIDQLSGFNVVGVITATSFTGDLTGDVTGNLTGNVTGNINNSTLLLQTGGTERLRITSDGKIGIGNNNPARILDVNGTARFSNGASIEWGGTSASIAGESSSNTLFFRTASAERLRITSTGNVGIGTDNPGRELDVYKGTGNDCTIVARVKSAGAWFEANSETSSGYYGLKLRNGNTEKWFLGSYGSNNLQLKTATANASSLLEITSDGKVGISETAPQALLHLNDGANSAIMFGNTTHGYKIRSNVTGSNDYGLLIEDEDGVDLYRAVSSTGSSNADTHTFYTAGAERLRITSTGRIEQKSNNEDIDMDATASGQLKLDGNGYNAALALNAQGLNIYNNSGNRGIIFGTNETERLRITSDGDVSITNGAFGGSGTAPKLNVVGSSGVMITHNNSTDRPTVGHSGNEPNITTFSNHFYNEVHRCITDFRSVCEGTHAGYILLVPAHPGSGNVSGKKFYGTIMCDRGSTGTGNSTQVAKIHASTAYSNSKFYVEIDRHSQYICGASKVTYSGTDYLAVRFNLGGGGPAYRTYIDGKHRGTDANFLRVVRENEVTVVDKHFGSLNTNPSGPPTCGVFVKNMTGSTYDNGTLSSGTVVYQYAPTGQNSPYSTSNGNFTARVNGLYLVCGGVLVQHNTGRLEGRLEWYNGSSWQTYVNFNGTGTTYDGPTFTCMIPLKEGYALRMKRDSGNAYNSAHPQNYFGVHLLHGLMRDDVPI